MNRVLFIKFVYAPGHWLGHIVAPFETKPVSLTQLGPYPLFRHNFV